MCAKLLLTLAKGQQIWTRIAIHFLEFAKLRSKGGSWENFNPRDKIMAPIWTSLILKGEVGELLNKCKKALTTLEWGGFERYFEHFETNWSPWSTKLGINLDSDYSREVARRLNNKRLTHLIDLWDLARRQWRDIEQT